MHPQPPLTLVSPSALSLPLPRALTLQKDMYIFITGEVYAIVQELEKLTVDSRHKLEPLKRLVLKDAITKVLDQFSKHLLTFAPPPILW